MCHVWPYNFASHYKQFFLIILFTWFVVHNLFLHYQDNRRQSSPSSPSSSGSSSGGSSSGGSSSGGASQTGTSSQTSGASQMTQPNMFINPSAFMMGGGSPSSSGGSGGSPSSSGGSGGTPSSSGGSGSSSSGGSSGSGGSSSVSIPQFDPNKLNQIQAGFLDPTKSKLGQGGGGGGGFNPDQINSMSFNFFNPNAMMGGGGR